MSSLRFVDAKHGKRGVTVPTRASAGRALSGQEGLSADRLFAELDHRPITGDPGGSTVEVISIHVTHDAGAWVQMEVAGESNEGVILHLPHSTTVDQAIAALNAWGQIARESRPMCIDVPAPGAARQTRAKQADPHPVRIEWASDPRRI
jgi:hypothetical protein